MATTTPEERRSIIPGTANADRALPVEAGTTMTGTMTGHDEALRDPEEALREATYE